MLCQNGVVSFNFAQSVFPHSGFQIIYSVKNAEKNVMSWDGCFQTYNQMFGRSTIPTIDLFQNKFMISSFPFGEVLANSDMDFSD